MKNNIINSHLNTFNSYQVRGALSEGFLKELEELKQKYFISDQEFAVPRDTTPLSIFRKELGILEALVQYLIDYARVPISAIATTLERSETTIRNSYRLGKKKGTIHVRASEPIPISVFADRGRAPLLALTAYLKERGWKLADIARALGRDPRNIGSTYRRLR